jgi:hypothetical protein
MHDDDNHHHPDEAPPPEALSSEALVLAKLEAIESQIDFLARLVCPVCGPALIVGVHPETGPQPRRPTGEAN